MKLRAISVIGYLIITVIIAAILMIISAPYLLDNSSSENAQKSADKNNKGGFDNYVLDVSEIENRINKKFEVLETRINEISNNQKSSDKYTCTIEGAVDNDGNIVPVENVSGNKKFVFVCEYNY